MTKLGATFILLFAMQIFFAGPVAAIPLQCSKSQVQKSPILLDRLSTIVLRIVGNVVSDPTALRMELKGVVEKVAGKAKIQDLQSDFGEAFKLRDESIEGEVNITSSIYAESMKYLSPAGEEKTVKLRFRRYFSQKVRDIFRSSLMPARGFEDQSMMEIKIQHPFKKNVVVKLRVKVFSNDIPHLSSVDFFTFKKQIRDRMLLLNKKKAEDVDLAIEFLSEAMNNPLRGRSGLFASTEYERESYSIKVPHVKAPGKVIEVQITADTNVKLTRLIDGQDFSVYGGDQVIYELKIPFDQSQLSEKDLEDYPGLKKIKEFKEWLEKNHDNEKEFNRGKINKVSGKLYYLDNERRAAKESIFEFLRKKGWIK